MYDLRFRQIHLDFHTSPDIPGIGEKFDKKQWQERLQEAHVDSITCFSSCHHGWSYHPTKVGKMHPHLNFNLLRAQMDACHEINVNVPVYLTGGVNNVAADAHPEWREMTFDGHYAGWSTSLLIPGFKKMCFNSPYLDYLCAMLRETTELFPDANGIFIDIISQGECCCPYCMKSMLAQGFDPEKKEDRLRHARQVLLNYYRRTTEAVRHQNPDMPVFHNSGNVKNGDHEILPYFSHLELESLPTGGWGYDHYPMSAAYSRNLGLDFLGMTGKFHGTWGEFGGFKHPNALRYECAAMIANNSKCSVGDQLHPSGELDKSTYEIIGKAYSEVEKCEPWCRKAESAAEVAILAGSDLPGTNANPDNTGASRFLLEEHIPFDMVDPLMDFSRYKILVAADSRPMDKTLHDKVASFIRNGGKVVMTSSAPFLSETDTVTDFPIPAEFGAVSESCPDFIRIAPELADFVKTPFVSLLPSRRMKATGGRSLGEVFDPYFNRTYQHFCSHQHTPYKPEPSGYHAGVIGGNVLYFAHPVFRSYVASGMVVMRHFIASAFRAFLGNSIQVETANMPSTGRVTLMKQTQENRYILHALYANTVQRGSAMDLPNNQRSTGGTEIIEELLPLRGSSYAVSVPAAVKSVTLQPENRSIPFTCEGGKVRFTIDEFTCHAMAEIRF